MQIKMLALDLDGTLLRSDKTLSEKTLRTLRLCRERHILLALATSRSEKSCGTYLAQVSPDFAILNGGALAKERGREIYLSQLEPETADRILRELLQSHYFDSLSLETASGYYVERRATSAWHYTNAKSRDFSEPLSEPAFKITAELRNPEVAEEIASRHPACTLVKFAGTNLFRFVHRNAGKIHAIRRIAELNHMQLSEVAAFGDDYIDIEMIRNCGCGVAMENAVPEVKRVADAVCGTNDRDGVADWLEKFILN